MELLAKDIETVEPIPVLITLKGGNNGNLILGFTERIYMQPNEPQTYLPEGSALSYLNMILVF